EIEAGRNVLDVDLPVSVIEGRITDTEGDPLAGVRVSAQRATGDDGGGRRMRRLFAFANQDGDVQTMSDDMGEDFVTTDGDGRYSLRGVTPAVELVVSGRGDQVQTGESDPVTVGPDEVRGGVDLVLESGGSIEVEVLMPDGSPASFAMVRAEFQDKGQLDEDERGSESVQPKFEFAQGGKTTLSGLHPGEWEVSINRAGPGAGEDPAPQRIEVEARRTIPTTFHLP
ncbi:MAG: carboxypeptidase-like regulatory domain-containing protein, partial [Planctomycetota bacterium]|nr:carboxypeptidase-like regulatory domain-containing protein [Planctomycetota bacterium]